MLSFLVEGVVTYIIWDFSVRTFFFKNHHFGTFSVTSLGLCFFITQDFPRSKCQDETRYAKDLLGDLPIKDEGEGGREDKRAFQTVTVLLLVMEKGRKEDWVGRVSDCSPFL